MKDEGLKGVDCCNKFLQFSVFHYVRNSTVKLYMVANDRTVPLVTSRILPVVNI